jgi:hypothetical protein
MHLFKCISWHINIFSLKKHYNLSLVDTLLHYCRLVVLK